jgi:hypothetical protein
MNWASATIFVGKGSFGTLVPKSLIAFVWHDKTTRTICAKGTFRKT